MKSNEWPRPPEFDRFESFGHDGLAAIHCYFKCSRPSHADGIKIPDKDDQATKYCFYLNVLWPGHLH